MSDKPLWVRWYSTDMLGSGRVAVMSRDEEFLYRRLLDYQASQGFIRPDPTRLAFACKMTAEEFARTWSAIADCFEEYETGRFRNKRMHAERERVFAAVESARENGRKGGRPAGSHEKADRKPGGSLQETGRVTGQEPGGKAIREPRAESRELGAESREQKGEQSPTAPAPARKPRPPTFSKDDALAMLPAEHATELRQTWTRWIEHLWQRKKPTRTVAESHLATCGEVWAKRGYPAVREMLDDCVANNTQGIPPWVRAKALNGAQLNGHHSHNGHTRGGRKTIQDRLAEGSLTLTEI